MIVHGIKNTIVKQNFTTDYSKRTDGLFDGINFF